MKKARKSPSLIVSHKEDGSPVTSADEWGNQYWEEVITKEFPGEIYIGEESKSHNFPKDAELVWFVDPIDGTREYVDGSGPYYTLIGLSVKGKAALGIVHEPESGKVFYGGENWGPFVINGSTNPEPVNGIRHWRRENMLLMRGIDADKRRRLKERFNIERRKFIGVTHNLLGPLYGKTSGFVSNRATSLWDLCAPAAVMSAAGYENKLVIDGHQARFNSGNYISDCFYLLPGDTPDDVKKALLS